METECKPEQLEFHALGRRDVIGRFDGGRITSDGGGLLLREVDKCLGLLDRLATCFSDYRNPNAIEHSVAALVAQRVYGLALGYIRIAPDPISGLRRQPACPGLSCCSRISSGRRVSRCTSACGNEISIPASLNAR